jgi:hypothetical protein
MATDISAVNTFQVQRRLIRQAFDGAELNEKLDAAVTALWASERRSQSASWRA